MRWRIVEVVRVHKISTQLTSEFLKAIREVFGLDLFRLAG